MTAVGGTDASNRASALDGQLFADVIGALIRAESPPTASIEGVMAAILEGRATDARIAGFLVALRAKGETPTELAAMVRLMYRYSQHVVVAQDHARGPLIDTCGTGGDGAGTLNVSTLAALIAAGAGARIAKHGNRAASSRCGSADVLDALGVSIELGPKGVASCIEQVGIGFCFAPTFHPAMRFASKVRRELGVPTTFNFLGPLANPAGVRHQVLGVSDPSMAERMLATLVELQAEHVLVVFGHDGLDELTLTTSSTVIELRDGTTRRYEVDPRELGLELVPSGDLGGGDATVNAQIIRDVLGGKAGGARDVGVLNAGAALLVAGQARDLADGVAKAAGAIDDGRVQRVLDDLVLVSQSARSLDGA